jgi:hypothetical protein
MSQENHKKRPVESHGAQPEKGTGSEENPLGRFKLYLFVLEQGAEEKDIKSQSFHHTSRGIRAVDAVGLNPGKRFLLPRDRRDVERDWRTCPFQDTVDEADNEEDGGQVGDEDTKGGIKAYSSYASKDKKEKEKNS